MQSTFIIGEQRSGSNLLRVILNCHSEIHAPHPPHIIERIEPFIQNYGDLSIDENFHTLIDHVIFLIDKNPIQWDFVPSHESVFKSCTKRSLFEVFKRIMELCAQEFKAQQWICKSNHIVNWSSLIEKNFENPKYIFLYRDPRDVVLSFLKTPVGDKHPFVIAQKWNSIQDKCLALSNSFPDRVLHVAYEDLIAKPYETVVSICDYLGIDYQDRMLNYFNDSEVQNTASKSQQWENINKPIILNNHSKYLQFHSDDLKMVESVCSKAMINLGYTDLKSENLITYSEDQIRAFGILNEKYKKEFQASLDEAEIQLRQEQKKILEIIQNGVQV